MAAEAIVVAQLISTTWSKRSRGQPLATKRNSVPECLALPDVVARRNHGCVVHRVAYGEINGYAASVSDTVDVYDAPPGPLTHAVGAYVDGEMLQVIFEGPYPEESELPPTVDARMGAPGRTVPRRPFALRLGEWGQIRYMGRLQKEWTAFTYYEKWVCNIGLFIAPSPGVFLDTRPRRHFTSMPDVW